MRSRPIGIGVQGLADAFMALKMPFDSPEARELNLKIFETIYHGAAEASCEMAKAEGPYEAWMGSPAQQGQLQFDLWGVTPTDLWDWKTLKENIAKYGMRNSLLTAPMPTASTSQMLGFNECFEPYTRQVFVVAFYRCFVDSLFSSNIYTRRVLAGEFQVVCPWLLRDLVDLGLWDDDMKNMLIAHHGSVQNIPGIPDNIKAIYKTVWEISQKKVLDLAADRGAYICQSQSLNIHLASPTMAQLTSMHFYGWKKGLKTGMYYLRTKPAAQAIQFTVDASVLKDAKMHQAKAAVDKKVTGLVSSKPAAAALFASSSGSSTPISSDSSSSPSFSPATPTSDVSASLDALSLDDKQKKAAEANPEFAAALLRQKEREYEEAKLMCSIENKEACLMCSG
jgi:ribonucleoside-diphosphate reductase subunit M1